MEASDYKKLTHIDHILQRPVTYLGPIGNVSSSVWVLDPVTLKAERKLIDYQPALEQLETEIGTNTYDNVPRSRGKNIAPGKIVQTVDKRVVSMYNEGAWIPVQKHPVELVYVPELIFFTLLTSSNYDDSAERTWAGSNGYGAKLTLVFSRWGEIECADPVNKLLYKQRCENNLKILHPPTIEPYNGKVGYTRVTYEADFERFGVTEYSDEMIKMFAFSAASASFTTKVPITFNGVVFDYGSIEKFATLFINNIENHLVYKDEHVELCLLDTPENGFNVSFVNGMFTKKGGTHVNNTLHVFSSTILEKLNKKKKIFDVRDVKKHLSLIISCTVINPIFTTQAKEEFARPAPKIDIPESAIKKLDKWNFVKQMSLYADLKLQGADKETKRKTKHVVVEDAEDANEAGGPLSSQCTLILTEGKSAKTFGMRYRGCVPNGLDFYGVFPLRGKGLNVRTATATQLVGNKELLAIRKLVGIKPGVDYTIPENRKDLRYGKVLFATDSDADGDHIKALGVNLFSYSYVSLTKQRFIGGLLTPLFKVSKGKISKYFVTKDEFHAWWDPLGSSGQKGWSVDYYKGLGRWSKEDFKDPNITKNFIEVDFIYDNEAENSLKLAFDKTYTDARKDWVSNVTPEQPVYSPTSDGSLVQTVTDFINTRLILFSLEDNSRSIPSMVDNFKPSQRKIFYATRKKKLGSKPIKIAQFMGYVAESTAYEHGEANVGSTIMTMCHDFPGANNIPLITGNGEYGTRISGGKDAADPRYVFMSKAPLADYIFREEDDILLEYLEVDGDIVEPKYYEPIICMTAVNGADGIGTGFSTSVPAYNPLDVIAFHRAWLTNNHPVEGETPEPYPDMIPWYRGFKGRVIEDKPGKYLTEGVMEVRGDVVHITELPINTWIANYSAFVDQLLTEKKIKTKKKSSLPEKVDFTLVGFANPSLKNLKLVTSISTNNIVLFNDDGYIVKFDNTESVIDDMSRHRYSQYGKRRTMLLEAYKEELRKEQQKVDFLGDVLEGSLILKDPDIEERMTEKGYPLIFLNMSLRSITPAGKAKHVAEKLAVEKKVIELTATTPRQMWEKELVDLEQALNRTYPRVKTVGK